MATLHEALAPRVDSWREAGWACEEHPTIAEIFEWAADPDGGVPRPRYLRLPQLRALETYWYLRLIEKTPHVFDLYERLFPKVTDRLDALGLGTAPLKEFVIDQGGPAALWGRIREDDDFVREHRLESVRETLTLSYPSYILALAMGAGKTALIGAVIATEFAMALDQPDQPFVENALVFAPGKTILHALRELLVVPYERILPPRLFKPFETSLKITFTRDGEKDIPVVRGSSFNVVVTNTEKIRIQKETIRKSDIGALFAGSPEESARAEVANLRLQAIASLPNLAVFSDEAHHTYGQSLQTELKKVRKTVDYLAARTNVLAVINTTGTPYFQRQPLRDVVVWYGLSQGIRDGILKDVAENIRALSLGDDAGAFASFVVQDFLRDYGAAALPSGAPAKLAIYFPQTDDLEAARPAIDEALLAAGLSPAVALRNTSESSQEEIDAFERLNDPQAPHRVILLVNKGTEGWNCPSLFATALARELKTSNNFVLQAATRCLRQVPGNRRRARIYLSEENVAVLDRQLQETYNETIAELDASVRERGQARLVVRKLEVPPLVITRTLRTVVPSGGPPGELTLSRPGSPAHAAATMTTFDLRAEEGTKRLLQRATDSVEIEALPPTIGLYEAAADLASSQRLDCWTVLDELRRLYPEHEVPLRDLEALRAQAADQSRRYEINEEQVEWAIALVKPNGFAEERDEIGNRRWVTEILYPKDRENLLLSAAKLAKDNPRDFGFHYDPYAFDSNPELHYFQEILKELRVHPAEVEDVYFTGGLTDPAKTDFFVEYRGEDGRWRRYTPDFVIRKRPQPGGEPGTGRALVVEVKSKQLEAATREDEARVRDGKQPITDEGRKAAALRRLEHLNPAKLRYELIFAGTTVTYDQLESARRFVRERETLYGDSLATAETLCEQIRSESDRKVSKVILFGSRARGDAKPDSDWDLLVVLADEIGAEEKGPYLANLYRAVRPAGVKAEPHVVGAIEFEESKFVPGSLCYPAWSEGVVLYEDP